MSERFLEGGRLLAFGRGPYATDAQHVSVEFVHPVIVGKRALPALDLSILFRPWLEAIAAARRHRDGLRAAGGRCGSRRRRSNRGDERGLHDVRSAGAARLVRAACRQRTDPFMHQEMIEILYHTLWETVHVFFEHRELGHDVGEAGFLYPFLGPARSRTRRNSRAKWPRRFE